MLPSESVAVLAVIDPDAYAAGAYSSGYVNISGYARLQAIVLAGDMGTNGTISAKLTVGTTAAGGTTEDITGATITQLTEAGVDSNKQGIINFDVATLAGTAYKYARLTVTVGTATSDMSAMLLGFEPRYAPSAGSTAVDSITSI